MIKGTGYSSGSIIVKIFNQEDNWEEALLDSYSIPLTTTGADFASLSITGSNLQEVTEQIVSSIVNPGFLSITGGNLQGELTLNNDPTLSSGAATKSYVDSILGHSIFVDDISDLPSPVGDLITLDENSVYIITGHVDLGNNRITLSSGSCLRGLCELNDTIKSTTTGAVINSDDVNAVIRDMGVVSPSGSPISLKGNNNVSCYIDHLRLLGCRDLGSIRGFEFVFVDRCVFKSTTETTTISGLRVGGTNTHTIITNNEFENLPTSGLSAITMQEDFMTDFAVISHNGFDITNNGIGISAEAGASGIRIIIRDNDFEGTTTPLSGITHFTPYYEIKGNTEIPDSTIKGGYSLNSSSDTNIATINVPVKVNGTTTIFPESERFEQTANNRLTFTGNRHCHVLVTYSYTISGSNNTLYSLYLALNGQIIENSKSIVRLGVGSDQRTGTGSTLVSMNNGDYLEVWIENNSGTDNPTVENLSLTATE